MGNSREVRIIGGQWRGRKLLFPKSKSLRPTTSRTRETLFNWLGISIQKIKCLDCFSGSGALAFEALSRYAASATLLEIEKRIAKELIKNLFILQAYNAKVIHGNTLKYLSKSGEAYQLVFIDPPFQERFLIAKTIKLLENNFWLSNKAWIYIESSAKSGLPLVPCNWFLYREKTAGQVTYRLYIRHCNTNT